MAVTRPRENRNRPSSTPLRASVAKNTTSPRAFTGATIGIDSAPNRSKTPPPGAASPLNATGCSGGAVVALATAAHDASAISSAATRPRAVWRTGMRGSIGR
jgi:hypothetical protein